MQNKIKIITTLLLLFAVSSYAQEVAKKRGYQGSFDVGGGVVVFESIASSIKADFINSYKFNDYCSAGIGLGAPQGRRSPDCP